MKWKTHDDFSSVKVISLILKLSIKISIKLRINLCAREHTEHLNNDWASEYSLLHRVLVKINEDFRVSQIGFRSSRINKSASNPYRFLAAVQVEVMRRDGPCTYVVAPSVFLRQRGWENHRHLFAVIWGQKYVKTRKNWWIQHLAQIFLNTFSME